MKAMGFKLPVCEGFAGQMLNYQNQQYILPQNQQMSEPVFNLFFFQRFFGVYNLIYFIFELIEYFLGGCYSLTFRRKPA